MALTPIRIPALRGGRAIVDGKGAPLNDFQGWINSAFSQLQNAQNATIAAQNAADAANAAAASANAAADSVTAESSLVNSFPTNYTPPLISADSLGNVTIANHDRQYGDVTLNPTVAVTGDVIATGAAVAATVRVYYLDPTRAGGAVAYLFTVDPADPPVQGGDTHVVGAVTIPGAGTQSGNGVRPPGFVEA